MSQKKIRNLQKHTSRHHIVIHTFTIQYNEKVAILLENCMHVFHHRVWMEYFFFYFFTFYKYRIFSLLFLRTFISFKLYKMDFSFSPTSASNSNDLKSFEHGFENKNWKRKKNRFSCWMALMKILKKGKIYEIEDFGLYLSYVDCFILFFSVLRKIKSD